MDSRWKGLRPAIIGRRNLAQRIYLSADERACDGTNSNSRPEGRKRMGSVESPFGPTRQGSREAWVTWRSLADCPAGASATESERAADGAHLDALPRRSPRAGQAR